MNPILIISPIPSHPQNQGNSARIYQLGKMWQQLGYKVHFLYFGLEGLTPTQEVDMKQCWDCFYHIQPQGPAAKPSFGDYYHIDDWYDDRVSILVEELCELWDFEYCIVNYVWFSKALEYVPDSVKKVIDTHDVFGDRHLVAKAAGMEPVWFYTSKELEALALTRADLVIAIQDEEAGYFKSITTTQVEVIGYVVPAEILLPAPKANNGKIRIGYIGSGNPFNSSSILAFQKALLESRIDTERFEFHLAGSVCKTLTENTDPFIVHGLVDNLTDFYRSMDVMVNPMLGGTGLKIKSIEALAYGRPLIATVDAMVGIESDCEYHSFDNLDVVVEFINIRLNQDFLSRMTKDSIQTLTIYNSRFINSFIEIFK